VLTGRRVDLGMIRYGSMPQTTMDCIARVIDELAPRRPLRVLHVGNFVGVSLAALSDIAAEHHPDSRVVSIDPNSRHLGVDDPQGHALALLGHFGLDHVNVLVCGYTLARAVSDGAAACAEVLASLEALGQRFDVAVIDGNHDPDYLRAELTALVRLIDDGGLLMLDDVSEQFVGVRALFEEAHRDPAWPLEQIAYDGERLGVLRKVGAGAA
jgi:predicted O-methyltransferase YrrM